MHCMPFRPGEGFLQIKVLKRYSDVMKFMVLFSTINYFAHIISRYYFRLEEHSSCLYFFFFVGANWLLG